MGLHSNIGPSSASRWIACPGSVALAAQCPKLPTNINAAQGTIAHGLAEALVSGKLDDLELFTKIGTVVKEDGFDIEITDEMVDGVALYRDVIEKDHAALLKRGKPASIARHAEVKVCIKSISPDLWGTADFLLFQKGHKLIVYDFKFGHGIVEAKENEQLGLYCLGAMETIAGSAYDEIELVIVQPRAGHVDGAVRRWTVSLDWLNKFRDKAKMAVQETQQPNARIVPGDHCKWCPAKVVCPALYKAAQESAGADFSVIVPEESPDKAKALLPDVRLMSVEKLAAAYSWREPIEAWFSSVADYIQEKLSAGENVPGYKLVDGRANRKWTDEKKVIEEWASLLPEGSMFEVKLLSPAKFEKLPGVGKGKIDHLTYKLEAKKAIARDVDPRPKATSKAQDDFPALEGKRDALWPL